MSDQGNRLMFLSFNCFSDSQAKKIAGKKWRIVLPAPTFFTDDVFINEILCQLFFFW